ncbi:hypothetical protein [Rhizobium skierniewicense]|uniref:hypothetical protein n=1 Tax=Rhizobium skierniewicense TaxID=984260 RepID=UPI0015721CBE|nr:hypothetical protein [Rhizobium skierniewicense]NTF33561.1 hypothetical protein [Rhizobium skierniewicense]
MTVAAPTLHAARRRNSSYLYAALLGVIADTCLFFRYKVWHGRLSQICRANILQQPRFLAQAA